jgi:membrane-bound lytic murein transglycosylase D
MKIRVGRTGLAVMMILSAGFVIFIFAGALNSNRAPETTNNEIITVASWDFPDEVSFAGEALPLTNFDTRESLDREVNATAYRHGSTLLTVKRAGRYFPEIEKILKENNIPDDFKYLACAESDLANAISPAGATGFWQIMEGTGREFGMTINKEVDERYCIEKSTRFACAFFRKAYEKYGSWTMAAAAYNNGINGLSEQVDIQKETNYYNLLLNEETARYIFRIVALKLIISDPASYGFSVSEKDIYQPIPYTEVSVDTTVASFEQFSRKFDTNYKMLKYLNPWLRKPYLTNSAGSEYKIRIPDKGVRESLGK